MKMLLFISGLLLSDSLCAQQSVFFRNVEFGSSDLVIAIGQHLNNSIDTFPQFWFVLDSLQDLEKIKKEWVFKKEVSNVRFENNTLDIFFIRDKRTMPGTGIIYPRQGVIRSENGWYKIDTAELAALHRLHPLRYHTKTFTFDTYLQYVTFGNSLLNEPSLLFFFQPYLKYEGKFTLVVKRARSRSGDIFAMHDLNKQLSSEFPHLEFNASIVNDEFNKASDDKTRITVESSKALYDSYHNKYAEKGEWQPTLIEVKTFWRD